MKTSPISSHSALRGSAAPWLRAPSGFTLVEMIVVIIIIGVLATLIAPRLIGRVGTAKQSTAAANAAAIASAVKLYQADHGALPDAGNLAVLAARPTTPDAKGPYLDNPDMLKDPWGKPFILKVPGEKNFDFDVLSFGADGKAGGSGEDADVVKP
jgi:general secretion pathway protein G